MLRILLLTVCLYHVGAGSLGSAADCDPIPASLTSQKTGQKAWDKCIEYQEKLIYPCEKSVSLTGEKSRGNYCKHTADELIVGGQDAAKQEFPHMALVGVGKLPDVQWPCGGAVISERFILAAGHCHSRDAGPPSYVRVGTLSYNITDNTRQYKIKSVHRHPDFKPPIKYNDIALLETEEEIQLDQFVVPACLHVGDEVKDQRALSTSWRTYNDHKKDILQKIPVKRICDSECAEKYPYSRLLREGVNFTTQLCYGSHFKDDCQYDIGGPLQVKSEQISCMYTVIGVASFGRPCRLGEPDIYTRVAAFVPWIESVVWP